MFVTESLCGCIANWIMSGKRIHSLKLTVLFALLLFVHPAARAWAPATATTTTLIASANGGEVTNVTAGTVVTLTATVKAGSAAQSLGQVAFCDATAEYCTDIHRIGVAQLNSSGQATMRFVPAIGDHTFKAEFAGTMASSSSSSPTSTLSVTGVYLTTTTISATGQPGNFSLTATVASTSRSDTPSGSVSFLDETNSGAVLGSASLAAGPISFNMFTGPVPALVGSYAATGDFNNDGKPDLVTIDGAGNVNVALGNGDGTFKALPAAALLAYSYVESIVVADFNSDGRADLAITGSTANMAILIGNGDGTFTVGSTPSVGNFPAGIAVGDWNRDGIPDLAVASVKGNEINILLGNGDGTFAAGTNVNTSAGPAVLVTQDFDQDGNLDLAVLTLSDYTVSVYLGKGDGTFTAVTTPAYTGFDLNSIVTGDFNGDGKPDIAMSGDFGVVVALGNGDGTFAPPEYVPAGEIAGGIVVGDFDGDGRVDIAVTDQNSAGTDGPQVLLGNGDGTFKSAKVFPGNFSDAPLVAADFNGDGLPDLVYVSGYTNAGTSPLAMLLAQGGTTSTAVVTKISPVGNTLHLVDGKYSGDANFDASVSPQIEVQAEPLTTQLALTAAPGTTTYGQQVVMTATLAPYHSSGGASDSELITFLNNGNVLGMGTLNSGVATFSTTSLPAGTNSLTASYGGDANFTHATSSAVPISVAKAQLTVVPANASRSYGQQNPALTGSVTGAINGDTFTVAGATVATLTSPVGTYPITYTVAGANIGDYSIVSATGTLTVTIATPTLTWPAPTSITYGTALSSSQLDATANTTGAFVYNPAAGTVLNAGTQSLTTTFTPKDAIDFVANTAMVSLVVNQASLKIGANNATRVYGTANPAFAGTVAGTVNGDSFTESFTTSAGATSNAGSYPIVPSISGSALSNYSVTATNGTLTVTQAGTGTTLSLSNRNLTMTATVASLTTGTPTGIVNFYQGQTQVGSGTLVSGVATYTTSTSPTSDVPISAQYVGDLNFTASSSTATPLLSVAAATSSLSISQAGSITDALTLAVVPGFTGTIQLSCSGLPQNATCSFQPASVAFMGTANSGSTTVTIDTGTIASLNMPSPLGTGKQQSMLALAFFWVPGISLLTLRKRGTFKGRKTLLLVLAAFALAGSLAGCGGGGSTKSPPITTPAGTSTVQVVASGGGITQTINLTLNVQ